MALGLVSAFFVQTWLVYSDAAGRQTPPLSAQAAEGQRLWLDHNCQSCHQIYGFGGFLGPDLTNAAQTLTTSRMDLMLTSGSGRMPAFQLGAGERRALHQFLIELDRTGQSQPRLRKKLPPDELLDELISKAELTAAERAGLQVMRKEKCIACHLPNFDTPVRAPDLTAVLERLGADKVGAVLAAGVPGTVMPRFMFSNDERSAVVAFLSWLGTHRGEAARVFEVTRPGSGSLLDLPWFEYE